MDTATVPIGQPGPLIDPKRILFIPQHIWQINPNIGYSHIVNTEGLEWGRNRSYTSPHALLITVTPPADYTTDDEPPELWDDAWNRLSTARLPFALRFLGELTVFTTPDFDRRQR